MELITPRREYSLFSNCVEVDGEDFSNLPKDFVFDDEYINARFDAVIIEDKSLLPILTIPQAVEYISEIYPFEYVVEKEDINLFFKPPFTYMVVTIELEVVFDDGRTVDQLSANERVERWRDYHMSLLYVTTNMSGPYKLVKSDGRTFIKEAMIVS